MSYPATGGYCLQLLKGPPRRHPTERFEGSGYAEFGYLADKSPQACCHTLHIVGVVVF
jgi:hypothetical protein